ncbi:unnamed protein product, partial [Arabidopsis halleri]
DSNIETTTTSQISDAGKAFACRRRTVSSILASFAASLVAMALLESSFPVVPFSGFILKRKASKLVTRDLNLPQIWRVHLFITTSISLIPEDPNIFSVLNRRPSSTHSFILHLSLFSVTAPQIRLVSVANLRFRQPPMDYYSRSISGFTPVASLCFILPDFILQVSFTVPVNILRKYSPSSVASKMRLVTLKICPANLSISLVMCGQESFSAVSRRSIPVIPRFIRALLLFPVTFTGGHLDYGSHHCISRKGILGQTPLTGLQRVNSGWVWPISFLIWAFPVPLNFVGLKIFWPIRKVKANWDCLYKSELWAHVGPTICLGSKPTYFKLWVF